MQEQLIQCPCCGQSLRIVVHQAEAEPVSLPRPRGGRDTRMTVGMTKGQKRVWDSAYVLGKVVEFFS